MGAPNFGGITKGLPLVAWIYNPYEEIEYIDWDNELDAYFAGNEEGLKNILLPENAEELEELKLEIAIKIVDFRYEDAYDELKPAIEEFNEKLQQEHYQAIDDLEDKLTDAQEENDFAQEEAIQEQINNLEYYGNVEVEIQNGYHEGFCLNTNFDDAKDMPENVRKEVLEFFNKMREDLFGMELEVAYRFSNGETGYKKVK